MSFQKTSTDIRLQQEGSRTLLRATTERADGIQNPGASIVLDDILGNEDGVFWWDGVNFTETARDIQLTIEGPGQPVLRALLQTRDGEWRGADVNLAERIENQDGDLVFI
ncbi:hypothetical protein RUND412_000819 [Rhizina undulata]